MKVIVANDDCVLSSSVHRGLHIDINDESFDVDCCALPLEGFDVVLGIWWMCALGPIVWDFDLLTMSFWWHYHQVIWQGLATDRGTPRVHACAQDDVMEADED